MPGTKLRHSTAVFALFAAPMPFAHAKTGTARFAPRGTRGRIRDRATAFAHPQCDLELRSFICLARSCVIPPPFSPSSRRQCHLHTPRRGQPDSLREERAVAYAIARRPSRIPNVIWN